MEAIYLKLVNYGFVFFLLLILISDDNFRKLHFKKISITTIFLISGLFLVGYVNTLIQNGVIVIFIMGTVRTILLKRKEIHAMEFLSKSSLILFITAFVLVFVNQLLQSLFILSFVIALSIGMVLLRYLKFNTKCAIVDENSCANEQISKEQQEYLENTLESIHKWFGHSKCYLQSDYSLDQLEKDLNISRKCISLAINKMEGKNFYQFIAYYRVKQAKKMILSNNRYTLESLSMECGFYSKSSFNKYFKKFEGKTPSGFKLSHS